MKCCNCGNNAFNADGGIALCLSCYTDYKNTANNNISSAFQLHRGPKVGSSMVKERARLPLNYHIEYHVKNEGITEVRNYNIGNNQVVNGNNNGTMNTEKSQLKNNKIGVANSTKEISHKISLIPKFIMKALKYFINFCLIKFGRLPI